VLLQGLVEREDDLAVGETVQGLALLLHPLHRPFLQTGKKKNKISITNSTLFITFS